MAQSVTTQDFPEKGHAHAGTRPAGPHPGAFRNATQYFAGSTRVLSAKYNPLVRHPVSRQATGFHPPSADMLQNDSVAHKRIRRAKGSMPLVRRTKKLYVVLRNRIPSPP